MSHILLSPSQPLERATQENLDVEVGYFLPNLTHCYLVLSQIAKPSSQDFSPLLQASPD